MEAADDYAMLAATVRARRGDAKSRIRVRYQRRIEVARARSSEQAVAATNVHRSSPAASTAFPARHSRADTYPERWAADSVIGRATSRMLPVNNWSAAVDDGSPWSGGSATPGSGRASRQVAPPGWQHIHLVPDGTRYHAVKLNAS